MRGAAITADQHAKERSIALAIVMDIGIVVAMIATSVLGGSFTLFAESIRAALGLLPEWLTYAVLRRIHRGVLVDLDYGTGKLEQIASLVIGTSMLAAAGWIVVGALRILSGDRAIGTPIGLACAAIAGMVNLYINVVAWDAIRRLVTARDSPLLQAQLTLRRTKLIASVMIGVALTVAALSTDDVIVASADFFGSCFVAVYMAFTGIQSLRGSLPELLDVSAGPAVRQALERSLARHAGDYLHLQRVRTRRSSHVAFVEIALAFDPGLSLAEVDRRVAALKATIREEGGEAEVSVLASAAPSNAAPPYGVDDLPA